MKGKLRKRKGASPHDASSNEQCTEVDSVAVSEVKPEKRSSSTLVEELQNSASIQEKDSDNFALQSKDSGKQRNGALPSGEHGELLPESYLGIWRREQQAPCGINVHVDIILCVLTAAAVVTRLWRLEEPSKVVFDEVHTGKFVSFYMRRMFFLDIQPPLGKLLLVFVAYMCNFDGTFLFNEIGEDYAGHRVPQFYMRLLPAICGSLLVPLVYQICVEFGLSHWTAAMAAFLVLFDNGLLTQSRFIMLDTLFMAFSLAGLLAYLKMTNCTDRPFSVRWWKWIVLSGLCLGCAVSTKYVGVMSIALVSILALVELWKMLPDQTITLRTLLHHAVARLQVVLTLPLLVYLLTFSVRFALLINSGPHDSLVSDEIKKTLIGSKLPVDQTLYKDYFEVAYGTQIMLHQSLPDGERHDHCWLHSHAHNYPVTYKDGRNSSQQQQVTCYNFKDINNWWIVKKPKRDLLTLGNPPELVKSGDVIELVHGTTHRQLNSHNVAGPLTKTAQEVSGYTNNSLDGFFKWRVELVGAEPGAIWRASRHSVQLVHVHSGTVLALSGERMPEWGFHQMEVISSKRGQHALSTWNIAEHQNAVASTTDPRAVSQQQLQKSLYRNSSQLVAVSFWTKLWHLQCAMIKVMDKLTGEHDYSSSASEWPLLSRGVAYWMSNVTNAQIYFIGNPCVWWPATAALLVFLGLWLLAAGTRRRQLPEFYSDIWRDLATSRAFFLGWCLYYSPYFFVHGMLFLHHYLPSLLFKIMLLSATVEQLFKMFKKPLMKVVAASAVILYLIAVLYTFGYFAPISYGHTALSNRAVADRQWRTNWELLMHVPLSPYLRQQLLLEKQRKLLKQQELQQRLRKEQQNVQQQQKQKEQQSKLEHKQQPEQPQLKEKIEENLHIGQQNLKNPQDKKS